MNLYQLDKQSTKFIIWKYWKGCVKNKLDGNDPKLCQQLMYLASRQCNCSHGTVCEGASVSYTNSCVETCWSFYFANNSCIFHHDNARAHTALSVRVLLSPKQIAVLKHPAYWPNLALIDIFLFPKVKEILKGRHFVGTDDISSNTTAALKASLQNQFQKCFEEWTGYWHRCIASLGEYLEDVGGGFKQWLM